MSEMHATFSAGAAGRLRTARLPAHAPRAAENGRRMDELSRARRRISNRNLFKFRRRRHYVITELFCGNLSYDVSEPNLRSFSQTIAS